MQIHADLKGKVAPDDMTLWIIIGNGIGASIMSLATVQKYTG